MRASCSSTPGNLVQGNFIGTDPSGTVAIANGTDGVSITAADNTVGGTTAGARNLISGNTTYGVHVDGSGATGNLIAGNYIGTDAGGTAAIGNGNNGVYLNAASNTVGGTTAESRNVISGNAGRGVEADQPNNLILGNDIGIDAAGTVAVPNLASGVFLAATGNTVGSLDPGGRNVVSGNNVQGGIAITASGNLVIGNYIGTDVAGTAAIPNEGGIDIVAPGNTIGGTDPDARNLISGNNATGIYLEASGNLIQGNYIGTDATGTAAVGNAPAGISGTSAGSDNTIGGTDTGAGNLISGNTGPGILLNATGILVLGNRIGTDAAGTAAARQRRRHRRRTRAATRSAARRRDAGNLISGNRSSGIELNIGANLLQGNRIGTDAAGTAAVGNSITASIVAASGNTIGGTDPDARNLISGNGGNGLEIDASGNLVQGNYVGTDAAGTAAVGNRSTGSICSRRGTRSAAPTRTPATSSPATAATASRSTPPGNLVQGNSIGTDAAGTVARGNGTGVRVFGGANVLSGNLISGNLGDGVVVAGGGGNRITANRIGVDSAGDLLGNGGAGITILNASNTAIGGIDSAALGNTIAHNGGAGVRIPTTPSGQVPLGNSILGNSITANGGLGIDLGARGVTPNDPADADTGPNGLQNAPVLQVLTVVNNDLLVTGTLQSTPGTTFRLEFFNDPGDPSGYGEGETLLAVRDVTTDATGRASYSFTLTGAVTLAGVITATATDPQGNTSEFSNGLPITNRPQFVVVNTNDAGPGSLRQAILDANMVPGEQQIRFAIPGHGPFVINLASPLPAISETVTINAGTQFGYNGSPIVAIAGMSAGSSTSGLTIAAPNVTIVDLAIAGFSDSGVDLLGGSARLVGNIIGTGFGDLPGNADFGVLVDSSSNVVGGPTTGDANSIAGNGGDGVHVASGHFNAILTNSITDNGGLGIRLAALAGAPRPNDGIVAPSLLGAGKVAGGLTRVTGVVVGEPGTTRLVQVFADPGDPSGYGEGAFYLGTVAVVIAPVGFGAFTFDSPMPVADGLVITATATDADGNTSEFSNATPQQPTLLDPFTVINTNDSGPGSLRQVILNANSVPGNQTITFAIPAAPDHAIHLLSALPAITDAVQIDGRTQSGPPVEIDGTMAGPTADGIVVQSGNSLIVGLVIENFAGNGILLAGAGGNQLVGNIIGVDPSTMIDRANGGDGVAVRDSADNTIALNIISMNLGSGISLLGAGTTGNLVQGNLIGTNANGLLPMGNHGDGVLIADGRPRQHDRRRVARGRPT